MTERRNEVAACGNYCGGCRDFLVLVKKDDAFRRQVAADLTKEVGRQVSPEEVGCEGCWGGIHSDLAASLNCRIRQCVAAKDFATCAECADFPCHMYLQQFPEDSPCARNVRAIRQGGLNEWIAEQQDQEVR